MNLRQIEVFHAVYMTGSVSAAARALGVSQPSVSKTLRHAEDQLGFLLFDRRNGRLIPTADAKAIFGDVAEIQSKVAALAQTGRNIRLGRGGTLRVAALPSLGLGILPAAVAQYLERHPTTGFELDVVHHADVARILFNQSADVVIAFEPPAGFPVATRWLGEGEVGLLSRASDGAAAGQRISISALAGQQIVSVAHSGPIGDMITREMVRLNLSVDQTLSSRTFYVAAALVRAGVRMALVDNFTAQSIDGPGLSFAPLKPAITFNVIAMWLETRPPTAQMDGFLDIVAKLVAQV